MTVLSILGIIDHSCPFPARGGIVINPALVLLMPLLIKIGSIHQPWLSVIGVYRPTTMLVR